MAKREKKHPIGTVCGVFGPDGRVTVECRKGQVFEVSGAMTREQAVHIAIGIIDALASEDERSIAAEVIEVPS